MVKCVNVKWHFRLSHITHALGCPDRDSKEIPSQCYTPQRYLCKETIQVISLILYPQNAEPHNGFSLTCTYLFSVFANAHTCEDGTCMEVRGELARANSVVHYVGLRE